MELRNRDSSHRHGVHANAKKEMSNRTGSIKRRYANDRALNNTTADAALDKRPFFRKSRVVATDRNRSQIRAPDKRRAPTRPATPEGRGFESRRSVKPRGDGLSAGPFVVSGDGQGDGAHRVDRPARRLGAQPNRILQTVGTEVQPPHPVKEQEGTCTNQDGAANDATSCEPVTERPKRPHHTGER